MIRSANRPRRRKPRRGRSQPYAPLSTTEPGYLWRPIEPPTPPPLQLVPPPPPPKLIPNFGHTLFSLLFVIPALIGGYIIALLSIYVAHPHIRIPILTQQIGQNVIYAISMQADSRSCGRWPLSSSPSGGAAPSPKASTGTSPPPRTVFCG